MFCNYDSSTNTEDIIWTETDGNLLGEVTGSPHLAVWSWWCTSTTTSPSTDSRWAP